MGFFCLAPVFWVIHRAGWLRTPLYGLLYGFLSYALLNFWLVKFHPLTILIVPPIYSIYFLFLFPLLKAADSLFPRYGFIVQTLIWVSYEFIKVQGFLAYSYGIVGYSQYLFLPLIKITELTGVWGVSFLAVFPSALLGNALKKSPSLFLPFVKKVMPSLIIYGALFGGVLIYGLIKVTDLKDSRLWKVALIQHNIDPWKGGFKAYKNSLDILTHLSSRAAAEHPEIIIWSETAFVPALYWHTRYRTDHEVYGLVKRLKDYLGRQEQPFVIGNDDGQLKRTASGQEVRVDYNATILFEGEEIIDTYRKLHLVPFTEHFPYRNILPGIYNWLRNADTHFWEKGTEYTVFEAGGVKFSTPICFEDTFGYLCRGFIKQGAEVLVNMTNDSWSNSVACAMQHMSMAVFRAVENRRSVVRATNGGITCVIDPNGRIIGRLEPFTEGYLISLVPVYTEKNTLYTSWGDWFALLLLLLSAVSIIVGLIFRLKTGLKKGLTRELESRRIKLARGRGNEVKR
ncbi:Apolipoprotein N-acyltransferase [subsurface metagenome]